MSTLLLQKDDDDAPRSSVVRRRSTRQRKMPTSTTAHSNHNNNNSPILNDNLRPISQVKTWKTKHWAAYLNEKVPLEAKAGFDQACFVMLGDDDDGDDDDDNVCRDAYSLWPALEINPQNIIQIVEKIKCLPSSTQTRKKISCWPISSIIRIVSTLLRLAPPIRRYSRRNSHSREEKHSKIAQ
mmetsp:Transcript_4738/g.6906  ORF Transcript_4738/g.6906 Transcript_4738/m.6906 type:complete len:183 (+) Transcript_4738:65-613(+)